MNPRADVLSANMAFPERSYYVTRTARALELAVEEPVTTAILAAELRVDARTARRLLARLAADDMLRPLGGHTQRYVPGPRLTALGSALTAPRPGPSSSARRTSG